MTIVVFSEWRNELSIINYLWCNLIFINCHCIATLATFRFKNSQLSIKQMSEQHTGEHHHHHHHKKDGASRFKQKSLAAIERRKLIEKVVKIATIVVAILMVILVGLAYTLG